MKKYVIAVVSFLMLVTASGAHAAVGDEITAFFTTLTTDFGTLQPLIAGLATLVIAFFMVLGWAIKGARKAS